MILLVINLDKSIFARDSKSLERLKEYSHLVGKIFVIVWTRKKEQPIEYDNKLFIYPTNSWCRIFYFFDTIKLFNKIKSKTKIDLMFTQDPFETGLVGMVIAKLFRIRIQLQIHTDIFSRYFRHESKINAIRYFLTKILIPRADCFRVVSARLKKGLIENFSIAAEQITVVPIFVERKSYIVDRKVEKDKIIFLTVGRLVPVKNIELQIRALSELVKKYKNIELLIVGDGEERERLKNLCQESRVADYVKFLGWQDDPEKYYKEADVFLLTSDYEGWGMVIIEAAACGLPVIMTDVGCAGEVIENEKSGLVIPVGDQAKLEEAMSRLIEDKNLRTKLSQGAQAAVLKLPTKEETLALYEKSWDLAHNAQRITRNA